jgi:(E)-4-hydroxy-3-methylbut-2-enyl-diphosphate synthase
MCDTKTENVSATVKQIRALEKAGCEMIRVAVPSMQAAKAIKKIKRQIKIPLIADIHFDPNLAIEAIKNGADKIRINPGNINNPTALKKIIKTAKSHKIPIRIGINSGSFNPSNANTQPLPKTFFTTPSKNVLRTFFTTPSTKERSQNVLHSPTQLASTAINWIKFFESQKFKNLVISIKSSDPETVVKANELLFASMKKRKKLYPIHLGVTEAGPLIAGITKSAVALSQLLKKGIGDTIRISLTDDPINEVKAAKELLKALNLYTKEPIIISCPTCGRTEIDLKKMVREVEEGLAEINFSKSKKSLPWQTFSPPKIAIMGCVVNGPGEAREADFAVCGGKRSAALYKKGKFIKTVTEKEAVKEFLKLIKKG